MNKWAWYGILAVGLTLICLPAFAQGLFPGLEVRDMKNWMITFAVGAVFTVFWYLIKRWIGVIDDLRKSVESLTMETKLHRQEATHYGVDIKMLKSVTNGLVDFKNKHINLHAKCRVCPEITEQ